MTAQLLYPLTNCMEQSPSWEANRSSPSQEIPLSYGTQRFITTLISPRRLSLSWASSIQSMFPSNVLKIHFNIIHPSRHRYSKWFCPTGFPHQNPVGTFPLPYVLHALPLRLIWFSELYLVRNTHHKAPHYVVFSSSLLPTPSHIASSILYSQKPSACVAFSRE